MNNVQSTPKVKRETKNTIKVEFDRTPFWERMKAKFVNKNFFVKLIWAIFRYVILIGISYIILFPFFTKIASSFMGPEDFVDATVKLIPKNFTLDTYKYIFLENKYMQALGNTALLSIAAALLQTFVCAMIGYGLAKFKFKGNKLLFVLVIFSMIIPHQTLQLSLFMKFRYFDVLGIIQTLGGGSRLFPHLNVTGGITSINLTNTFWPLALLSATGLAFKNGLYIFMMRQFYRGVPNELEESAYIDGSGIFSTFIRIILPLSIPMMITVFLFAFSWQWTDTFYTSLFWTRSSVVLMKNVIAIPESLNITYAGSNMYNAAIRNTCGLMIIAPLVIIYLFCQRYLIQGIERSGMTAD
ncbi:MAG: carbohydrate ABC transporter permease [Clostridia bacterium]|nr:carbohydrate ABC transporter permease [Clostridia bacterium]MBP5208834.1 carbohydrate ABC transporter permease [Clostridia bacterium]